MQFKLWCCLPLMALGGCGLFSDEMLKEGPVSPLPEQPAVTGQAAAPTAVTILLPSDVYKTLPPKDQDSTSATEAQLETIENYGLHLDSDDRALLEDRVNDCRFTAHEACSLQAAPAPMPAKG